MNAAFFKDLSALGIANISGGVIGAIFWLYLASLMGEEQYGEVSYLLAIASIASAVCLLGGPGTLIVYTAKNVKIQPTIFLVVISAGLVAAIATMFLFNNVGISAYVIGYVIFNLAIAELLGRKLYRVYARYFIIQKILVVIFAIILYFIMGPTGIVLGYALSFIPFSYRVFKNFKDTKIDFGLLRPRLGFMTNNYVTDLTRALGGQTDRLIIAPLLGFTLLGNYHLGFQFLAILTLLPGIVFQYILPQDASGVSKRKLKQITILISGGLTILGIFVAPHVIPFFFEKFQEAVGIVQILSIGIIPLTINMILTSKFLGMEKSRFIVIGQLLYLVVQIPLIFILGEHIGINGVALAFVFGEITRTIFLFGSLKYSKLDCF